MFYSLELPETLNGPVYIGSSGKYLAYGAKAHGRLTPEADAWCWENLRQQPGVRSHIERKRDDSYTTMVTMVFWSEIDMLHFKMMWL